MHNINKQNDILAPGSRILHIPYLSLVVHEYPYHNDVMVSQACDWKKILKLIAKLKNAYFSATAQIKLAFINSCTVFRRFEVKDS